MLNDEEKGYLEDKYPFVVIGQNTYNMDTDDKDLISLYSTLKPNTIIPDNELAIGSKKYVNGKPVVITDIFGKFEIPAEDKTDFETLTQDRNYDILRNTFNKSGFEYFDLEKIIKVLRPDQVSTSTDWAGRAIPDPLADGTFQEQLLPKSSFKNELDPFKMNLPLHPFTKQRIIKSLQIFEKVSELDINTPFTPSEVETIFDKKIEFQKKYIAQLFYKYRENANDELDNAKGEYKEELKKLQRLGNSNFGMNDLQSYTNKAELKLEGIKKIFGLLYKRMGFIREHDKALYEYCGGLDIKSCHKSKKEQKSQLSLRKEFLRKEFLGNQKIVIK